MPNQYLKYIEILKDVQRAIKLRLVGYQVSADDDLHSMTPKEASPKGWSSTATVWKDDYQSIINSIRQANPKYKGFPSLRSEQEKSYGLEIQWLRDSIAVRLQNFIA